MEFSDANSKPEEEDFPNGQEDDVNESATMFTEMGGSHGSMKDLVEALKKRRKK